MHNLTPKKELEFTVTNNLAESLVDSLAYQIESFEFGDSLTDITDELMETYQGSCGEYQVIYAHEAFEIIGSNDFPDVHNMNFSDCDSATACMIKEAQAQANELYDQELTNALDAVSCDLYDMFKLAQKCDAVTDKLSIQFVRGSSFGWDIIREETKSGVEIYDNGIEYNIIGDCYAVMR